MPRIMIKGGVWRNTEDEILKAAVMKYGLNQWSRIASLLHRKSSKQCKARWQEWLDPIIKKTEWSHEEEEKLLHLTKLMPTQWRTIAPIVGRTAAQCLEHYEYLLNKNLNSEEGDDIRKLKPGEIDPAPETKPARPDPIDMDEDEIEMLSEARARLANTQGKKAKRKAREKQLDEARRLASLQKRRELKAAGIQLKKKRNKRGRIDYNAEIPFEKKPALGFYDTEQEKIANEDINFRKLRQDHLDKQTVQEKEERARQNDNKKTKDKELTSALKKRANSPPRKRSKLVLPTPQVTDAELEEVIKVSQVTQMYSNMNEGGDAHDSLTADYSDAYVAGSSGLGGVAQRTPMPEKDHIGEMALNIMHMQNVDTPLKGGQNTPMVQDFSRTLAAQRADLQTPNTVLTTPAIRAYGEEGSNAIATPGMTPRSTMSGATPGATPVHDKLNINSYEQTPNRSAADEKRRVRERLAMLPKPTNDFEVVLPGEDEELNADEDEEDAADPSFVEDAADVLTRQQEAIALAEKESMARRHAAVRKGLPRPTAVNETVLRGHSKDMDEMQHIEELIKREMITMLHHDALHNTSANQAPSKQNKKAQSAQSHVNYLKKHEYEEVEPEDLEEAKEMLAAEMKMMQESSQQKNLTLDTFDSVWHECYSRLLYLPSTNKYTHRDRATKKERIESLAMQLTTNREHMTREARKASKIEKKLKILCGGYMTRNAMLVKQIAETNESLEQSHIQLCTFEELLRRERGAVVKRQAAIKEDVRKQVERENVLQEQYRVLLADLALLKHQHEAAPTPVVVTESATVEAEVEQNGNDEPMEV